MDGLFASLRSTKESRLGAEIGVSISVNKLSQLNEKLAGLQPPPLLEQPVRNYQQRLKQLEQITDKRFLQDQQSFGDIKAQLLKASSEITEERSSIDEIEIAAQKEIKLLQSDMMKQQVAFRADCKQRDLRVLQLFEESSTELKQQWRQHVRQTTEVETETKRELEAQVSALEDALTYEVKLRQQKNDGVITSLSTALNSLTNTLHQERKKRQENHLLMLRQLEELDASMKQEVRQQQTVRERADQLLYRLLQETCTKVEGCLLKRRYY